MDKFGSRIEKDADPSDKKRGDYGVYAKHSYTGPRRLACWLYKAKSEGKISRMLGKWNKRYFILDLDELKMFYTTKPGKVGKDVKYLLLNVKIPLNIIIYLKYPKN